jgi:hypothetical protein
MSFFSFKGAIFSNNKFQICVPVHIHPLTYSVTHHILNVFFGQCASHETFFQIASDTDYGLNKHSVQLLPDLCADYVSQSFTRVRFYVSRNFFKFNSIILSQGPEKLQKCTSKCIIKRLRQVPVQNRM